MLRHKVWVLARDLDGRVVSRHLRAAFTDEQRAVEYVRQFANDMLNWKYDFEITAGDER